MTKRACPADTDAQLDTFARNASSEIQKRSGKVVPASKIRADVLSVVAAVDPNRTRSCLDQFTLYVISETS